MIVEIGDLIRPKLEPWMHWLSMKNDVDPWEMVNVPTFIVHYVDFFPYESKILVTCKVDGFKSDAIYFWLDEIEQIVRKPNINKINIEFTLE